MTGWSLSGRLMRRLTLALGLGWFLVIGAGLFVIAHEMNELLDEALESQSRIALEYLRAGGGGRLPVGEDEAARVVVGGVERRAAPWPALARDGHWEGAGWHVMRRSDPVRGIVVELGQSGEWRHDELWETGQAFVWLVLPFLALFAITLHLTVRGGLAPARRFAARVAGRAAQDLSPLPDDGLPAELTPLPAALNGYLARIEALLVAERAFAGHAAHELRTPLAAASAQAQLLAAGTAGPDTARQLTGALSRLGGTVERLLQLSRAEAGIGPGRADLIEVIRLLLEGMAPGDVVFDDGDMEAAPVALDPDALAILLGNLLRNAREHGTGRVELRLGPGPVLRIRNPVAEGARFRTGRFDKAPDSAGSGLGLTIAEAIARQNGVALSLHIGAGWAEARLDFPPA